MNNPVNRFILAGIFAAIGYVAVKLLLDGAPAAVDTWIGTFSSGIVIGGAVVLALSWSRRRKQAKEGDQPQG
ncbi:hypothetical protein [Nocardia harenae]|uniref:hypothetical protein n=1 Tax=Nocardia harenae TaxID=358707 RepID=UPI00082ACEA7|nr:hypothetical protein [Nocardia harenae]